MQNESVILKHPSQEELLETYSIGLDCIALHCPKSHRSLLAPSSGIILYYHRWWSVVELE